MNHNQKIASLAIILSTIGGANLAIAQTSWDILPAGIELTPKHSGASILDMKKDDLVKSRGSYEGTNKLINKLRFSSDLKQSWILTQVEGTPSNAYGFAKLVRVISYELLVTDNFDVLPLAEKLEIFLLSRMSGDNQVAEKIIRAQKGDVTAQWRLANDMLAAIKLTYESEYRNDIFDPVLGVDYGMSEAEITAKRAPIRAALEAYVEKLSKHVQTLEKKVDAQFKQQFDTWEVARKRLKEVEAKYPKLQDIVAANDRQKFAEVVNQYLPWPMMTEMEKKMWTETLDAIKKPRPENLRIFFRGTDPENDRQMVVPGKNSPEKPFFFSVLLSRGMNSYMSRLGKLTKTRYLNYVQGKESADAYLETKDKEKPRSGFYSLLNMFRAHAGNPVASPFLSFTPDLSVALSFGSQSGGGLMAAMIDDRRLIYSPDSLVGEKEVLVPLVVFPDEVLFHVDIPPAERKLHIDRYMSYKIDRFGAYVYDGRGNLISNGEEIYKSLQVDTEKQTRQYREKVTEAIRDVVAKGIIPKSTADKVLEIANDQEKASEYFYQNQREETRRLMDSVQVVPIRCMNIFGG